MPTHSLNVPHRQQEEAAGCLAASAQMVLDYLGIRQSQTALNRLLGLSSIGTPYSSIRRLASLGVGVTLQRSTEDDLRAAVDGGLPPIVFVKTGHLSYWLDNTSHAVVVTGYDEDAVFLNDPAFASAPQRVTWQEFMLAWDEQDNSYALIQR